MIRIGVTGGIGSGKTTLCSVWERLGARVVYADALAKSLMTSDTELREQIMSTFGEDAYHPDGSLQRKVLARIAFEEGRVEELNDLVHPVVYRKLEELEKKAKEEGVPVFVCESALLLDRGRPDNLDAVIMISAPEDIRVERVTQRDQSDPEQVQERIRKQKDFSQLAPLADIIVSNDDTKELLEKKAEVIYNELRSADEAF